MVYSDCWYDFSLSLSPGLGMEWVVEPPDEMEKGQVHNVSYRATVTSTLHVAFPGMWVQLYHSILSQVRLSRLCVLI